jgi:uncharacterized NAD-dependent epimerase/dehydratase family protein
LRRYAILTEGSLGDIIHGKTAQGLIRYRPHEVVVVIDSEYAGKRVRDVIPALDSDAPIVGAMSDALEFHPSTLLIGVATDGGNLPPAMRAPLLQAVEAGLEIVNGLHAFLRDDVEVTERAARSGARLWDVRSMAETTALFTGRAYDVRQYVVLAVGSDCAVGKMTAMLEIERAAIALRARTKFVATGQTGIMITGAGLPLDRMVGDFITGGAERLVVDASPEVDVLLVEGQGSLIHPAYAPVTLGLLYGCAPDALILCHRINTNRIAGFDTRIPDLHELIEMHEALLRYLKPARVVAIVLDTSSVDETSARLAIDEATRLTGLTVDDPVRNGGAALWNAIEAGLVHTDKTRRQAAAT